jgi:hypothetical protein
MVKNQPCPLSIDLKFAGCSGSGRAWNRRWIFFGTRSLEIRWTALSRTAFTLQNEGLLAKHDAVKRGFDATVECRCPRMSHDSVFELRLCTLTLHS